MPDTPPLPARPEACNSCRFWTAPAAGPLGTCRRFPLAERKEAGDWCGEHKPAGVPVSQSDVVNGAAVRDLKEGEAIRMTPEELQKLPRRAGEKKGRKHERRDQAG